MDIDDPTTAVGALDAATAAPAAVLTALPTATPESTSGQMQIWKRCPALSRLQPALIDAPVCGAYYCAGALLPILAMPARTVASGAAACEKCGRQLTKVKHHRAHGAGRACTPRCKPFKHAVDSAALVPAVAVRSHKREPTDPGKQQPAPSVLIAPPPLLTPATATPTWLHDRDSWKDQGWKMIRGIARESP